MWGVGGDVMYTSYMCIAWRGDQVWGVGGGRNVYLVHVYCMEGRPGVGCVGDVMYTSYIA